MLLVIGIFIAVIFLALFAYFVIDNQIERKSFRDIMHIVGRLIEKCEELTNDLHTVLERCKEAERENAALRSIITLNDCDEYLRQQEEDGNI